LDQGTVDQALRGNAPGAPQIAAALLFLKRLTLAPETLAADAVDPLRQAGVGSNGLLDLIVICFGFSLINRLSEAFGFETPSVGVNKEAAFLWTAGYRLASGVWFRRSGARTVEGGIQRMFDTAVERPAAVPIEARRAVYCGIDLTEPVGSYVRAVRNCAMPPDGQELLLSEAGYPEDQIFEIAVCAALGAAAIRLESGLAATGIQLNLRLPSRSEALSPFDGGSR
jgi:hypothetical protein